MMRHVGLPIWKLPMVARDFRAAMKENRAAVSLFGGVDALLQYLARQGVMLAVVSANSHENVSHILGPGNTELVGFFECGASIFGKAAHLRRVLRRSGVPAADAIYIGDQTADLEAARSAGIAFGAVAWGYGDIASLRTGSPDQEFGSVAELRRIAAGFDRKVPCGGAGIGAQ
jgi:phosphoglycolate phosphatase